MTKNAPENNPIHFNPNQHTVIDASAGTGKTYTITSIIVPLLLDKYSLGQILIVTYTTKAARELRARIRKELVNISKSLQDSTDPDDKARKNKIDGEIETIDDAPIFTIHSFCQKTLSENAIFSNVSQNMTLIDEKSGLANFISKYIFDKLATDKDGEFMRVFMRLYNTNTNPFQPSGQEKFKQYVIDAIQKYYLKDGREDENIISLQNLTPDEEAEFQKLITEPNIKDKDIPFLRRCLVTKYLKDIYVAWQQEKIDKNLQTYGDMIKTVHDALVAPGSELLRELKNKYKYAIIDEFQDTNQLQWNIFKQIFTTDDEHHITIVGDPKQSIFSFQGADVAVYYIAKEYLEKNPNTNVVNLNTNYRSTADMINAINALSHEIFFDASHTYHGSQFPSPDKKPIRPPLFNGAGIAPVHFVENSVESIIISTIKEYCDKNDDGKTKLQVWYKDKNNENNSRYRNVNYGDFAVLVRKHKHADTFIKQMIDAKIPFMWHKSESLFSDKEAADWAALLSAIQTPDFDSSSANRTILRCALQTAFFDIPIDNVSDEKYTDILSDERQLLLKWYNLAQTKQYGRLINSIFEDSEISKRLVGYENLQTMAKYNQIGNFILDSLVSKHTSVANIIKTLRQLATSNPENDDKNAVQQATDAPAVKLSTIHSAKGLEFPITIYLMNKDDPHEQYASVEHVTDDNDDTATHLIIGNGEKSLNKAEENALRYVAMTRATSLMFIKAEKKVIEHEDLFMIAPHLFVKDDMFFKTKPAVEPVKCDSDDDDKKPGTIRLSAKRMYKHSYTSLSHPKNGSDADSNVLMTDKNQRINKEEDFDTANTVSTAQYDADCGVKICDGMYDADNLSDVCSDAHGKKYGTLIHEIFEQIDFRVFDTHNRQMYQDYLMPIIEKCCKKYSLYCSHADITGFVINTMAAQFPEIIGNHATGGKFLLSAVSQQDKKSELEFDLNLDTAKLQNYCNGFIDLLFVRETGGKKVYSILDWKTDLFQNAADYANYDYLQSHTNDKYAIQRVLYSYCLIQWLKQFYPSQTESDIFNNHFGGMYYVYVRGCNSGTGNGIYAHTWKNYDTLNAAFQNILTQIIGNNNG